MVYRLKEVRYQGTARRILLQNENGPCPLLAAANILLLKGVCALPSASIRNGVSSLEDVTNMLAEYAMRTSTSDHAVYVDELVQWIPKFQFGMDVNPSFTQGITGYEYTSQMTAFDMMQCKLVHGWLVDVQDEETFRAVGTKTYNQLVEQVIHGNEALGEMERLRERINGCKQTPVDLLDTDASGAQQQHSKEIQELETKISALEQQSHDALLIQHFFESSGHQLTFYGLLQLQESLQEDELAVFFRNNHFGTLTKHEGHLYLLVTDLGYANSPAVVWERLDVIDGDTDYANSDFQASRQTDQLLLTSGPTLTPEQMMAASGQSEADYQLALQLSKHPESNANQVLDEQEGKLMAAATEASLREYHGIVDPTSITQEQKSVPGDHDVQSGGTIVDLPPISSNPDQPKAPPSGMSQEDADRLLAMQLQGEESAPPASSQHEGASLHLAQQLQFEENQRRRPVRSPAPTTQQQQSSASSSCLIS